MANTERTAPGPRRTRRILTRAPLAGALLATSVVVGVGSSVATASPASAGTCIPGTDYCSRVRNWSQGAILVANSWCFSDGRTSSVYELPSCGSYTTLMPRAGSWRGFSEDLGPAWRDTDAVRAQGGCITRIEGLGSPMNVDRRGKGSQWFKVSDVQTAYVTSISC